MILGAIAAKTCGIDTGKAVLRITVWGTLAMGLSGVVGYIFGVKL